MELVWARYEKGNSSKYLLLLHLGSYKGKFVGLLSDKIPANIARTISASKDDLDKMSLKERVAWIKKVLPSYSSAYREINNDRISVEKRYKL
jgi:hypothetical protein